MVKYFPAKEGDMGLTPGLGRSPAEGNGNPLQYSCLENSMVRGVWWDPVQGVKKESDITEHTHTPVVRTSAFTARHGFKSWLGAESRLQLTRHSQKKQA